MKILLIGFGHTGKDIANGLFVIGHKIFFISDKKEKSRFKQVSVDSAPKDIGCIIIVLSTLSDEKRKKITYKVKNTYDLRHSELKGNINAIKEYISFLNDSNADRIIIVSNPVDEITNYLCKNVPNKRIFGFGMQLDVNRFSKKLKKKVDCIGVHGKAIPLIDYDSEDKYNKILSDIDRELLAFVKKNGIPHKIAGSEFIKFFNGLTSKKKNIVYASQYIKRSFLDIKDIAIFLPLIIKDGKIIGIKKLSINNIERRLFLNETRHLKKEMLKLK